MTIINPSTTVLDVDQLAEFELTLRAMLKERVRPASGDATGEARHRSQTKALEAALARIEDRTFGRCRWCQAAIAVQRLEVVPTARGCMACTAGTR